MLAVPQQTRKGAPHHHELPTNTLLLGKEPLSSPSDLTNCVDKWTSQMCWTCSSYGYGG